MPLSTVTTNLPARLVLALMLVLSIVSCRTTEITQVSEHVQRDTFYLSTLRYDSIYVNHERTTDYRLHASDSSRTDTLVITDVSLEYRYRLLRDTIYKTRCDSIPYEVIVYRDRKPSFWASLHDGVCRLLAFAILAFAFWFVLRRKRVF